MRFIAGSGYAARKLTKEIAGGRVPVGVRKPATRIAKPSQVASR
jgi:hypothetical protein